MAISQIYLKAKSTLVQLEGVRSQLSDIVTVLNTIENLVARGIFTFEEAKDIKDSFKLGLKATVNTILHTQDLQSVIQSLSAEAETNSKLKGMATIISSVPVIIPPPADAAAFEAILIALGVEATGTLSRVILDIAAVTG